MATHSSFLAWRIPGTEEPSGLPSMGLHRVGHYWSDLAVAAATITKGLKDYKTTVTYNSKTKKCPAEKICVIEIFLALLESKVYLKDSNGETDIENRLMGMGRGEERVRWMEKITWKLTLLLLSRFSRVRLCATPQTAAHQAPMSLGFSRQEHWSGLPFPSPMHESEKWKWSRSAVSNS